MSLIGAAIIGGLAGLGGSFITGEQSRKAASKQMDFQEEMSRTAHQREVKDLKKAGLNPVLSSFGQGATTPAGSQPTIPDYGKSITGGVNSAVALKTANANIANIEGQADTSKARGQLDKWTMEYLKQSPELLDLTLGANLFKQTGLPPSLGAGAGKFTEWMRSLKSIPKTFDKPKIRKMIPLQ